ncbi:uncharacterized protein LOC143556845 [Bidens hawaiensis]|uniref:uncharacterized protein LOC143556845 n=1 Tax=Bidens hawaiensis TaxID=980011 RepID=UPI00404905CD
MVKTHGGATADEDMKPPLHNFDLPCLKWGNQKLLRCMKVESTADRPETSTPPRRNSEFRFRSSDRYRFPSSEKLPARITDGEIEATREKLMFDFQKEVVKMKDAILRDTTAATATVSNQTPWNLRTRLAALTAANGVDVNVNNNGEVLKLKPNSNCMYYSPALTASTDAVNASVSGEKRERPKFSVSLSRRELEDDFLAMAGRRLPRKPKKRPRIVQRQLDTLFPGLWLSEITADIYKVPDESETAGKR